MLKNLFRVTRRFKAAFLLNVLGLAVAFTAFMMIMMQVRHDLTFDRCHEGAERIFRLDVEANGSGQAIVNRPLARLFCQSSPEITAGCIMEAGPSSNFWYTGEGGTRKGSKESFWDVSPGILDVFGFRMVEGGRDALDAPLSAVIPESMATRLFGDEPATGKLLHPSADGDVERTITGVYKDFPRNSSLPNIVYLSKNPQENYDNWGNWNYYCFVRLSDSADPEQIVENFKKNNTTLFSEGFSWEGGNFKMTLHSLPELHFNSAGLFDGLPKASKGMVNALIAIAFVILLIAGINFTNFSTALAPMRIKGINTRKVLGSPNAGIRLGIIGETVFVCLVSFLLAVLMLHISSMTPLKELLDCDMTLRMNSGTVAAGAVASMMLGILSGLYPAFYMTSVSPAMVLKGSFGLSPAGKRMRSILVGMQFAASFALVTTASFIFLQNRFMTNTPLGFDKDQVIVVDINDKIRNNSEAFSEELRSRAGIEAVSYAAFTLSSGDYFMTWGREFRGENIQFACFPADHNILDVLGIPVTEGRNFSEDDEIKENGSYIFNETARKQFDMHPGEIMNKDEIIGFMPDINFASMRRSVSPMAFLVFGSNNWGYTYQTAYIKVAAGSDLRVARRDITECLRTFDSEYPFEVRFYDSILENTYQKEQRTGSLIALFSLVAIFISIVGVFSLVVFDCEYRRKETAIRKVLGSTGGEITGMFCRSYLTVLAVCFAIGAPVAWLAVDKWLESFAYRTPLHWWVFPSAFAAIAAVTLLTVAWQSWRVANENPVKNLRAE